MTDKQVPIAQRWASDEVPVQVLTLPTESGDYPRIPLEEPAPAEGDNSTE